MTSLSAAPIAKRFGKALRGHVSVEDRTIFVECFVFDDLIGPAITAISFYKAQLSACRRAVDAWSHVGLRFNVVKDIRVLIGKMIWETRDLALFSVREECAVASPDLKSGCE